MTLSAAGVLRPGDWVAYDGGEHQVVALAGTSVRLRSDDGAESVVLVAYLLASPEFGLINGAPAPSVEPFGLLDGLPTAVLDAARDWERHVVEVETGLTHAGLAMKDNFFWPGFILLAVAVFGMISTVAAAAYDITSGSPRRCSSPCSERSPERYGSSWSFAA